jgi:hypothetical protein
MLFFNKIHIQLCSQKKKLEPVDSTAAAGRFFFNKSARRRIHVLYSGVNYINHLISPMSLKLSLKSFLYISPLAYCILLQKRSDPCMLNRFSYVLTDINTENYLTKFDITKVFKCLSDLIFMKNVSKPQGVGDTVFNLIGKKLHIL